MDIAKAAEEERMNALAGEIQQILTASTGKPKEEGEEDDGPDEIASCVAEMTLNDYLQIPTSYVAQPSPGSMILDDYCMVQEGTVLYRFLDYLTTNQATLNCINEMQREGRSDVRPISELQTTTRRDGAKMVMCVPSELVNGAAQFLKTHFLLGLDKDLQARLSIADKVSFNNFTIDRFNDFLDFIAMPGALKSELIDVFREDEAPVKRVFSVLTQLSVSGHMRLHENTQLHSDKKRQFGKVVNKKQEEEEASEGSTAGGGTAEQANDQPTEKLHGMLHAQLSHIVKEGTVDIEAKKKIADAVDIIKDVASKKKDALSECDRHGKHKGILHAPLEFRMGYLMGLVAEAAYVSMSIFKEDETGEEDNEEGTVIALELISILAGINEANIMMKKRQRINA